MRGIGACVAAQSVRWCSKSSGENTNEERKAFSTKIDRRKPLWWSHHRCTIAAAAASFRSECCFVSSIFNQDATGETTSTSAKIVLVGIAACTVKHGGETL
jgi:hypothetical protein